MTKINRYIFFILFFTFFSQIVVHAQQIPLIKKIRVGCAHDSDYKDTFGGSITNYANFYYDEVYPPDAGGGKGIYIYGLATPSSITNLRINYYAYDYDGNLHASIPTIWPVGGNNGTFDVDCFSWGTIENKDNYPGEFGWALPLEPHRYITKYIIEIGSIAYCGSEECPQPCSPGGCLLKPYVTVTINISPCLPLQCYYPPTDSCGCPSGYICRGQCYTCAQLGMCTGIDEKCYYQGDCRCTGCPQYYTCKINWLGNGVCVCTHCACYPNGCPTGTVCTCGGGCCATTGKDPNTDCRSCGCPCGYTCLTYSGVDACYPDTSCMVNGCPSGECCEGTSGTCQVHCTCTCSSAVVGTELEKDIRTFVLFGEIIRFHSSIPKHYIQIYFSHSEEIANALAEDSDLRLMARGIIERYKVIIDGIVNNNLPPGQLNRVITPGDIKTLQLYLSKFASRPNQDPALTNMIMELYGKLPQYEGVTVGDVLNSLGIIVNTKH